MKDQHRSLVGREAQESALELITQGQATLRIAAGAVHVHVDLDDPTTALLSGRSIAGVHEEPLQPGVEAVGIAQPGQSGPGPQERILDGVPGPVIVADDQARDGVQAVDRATNERREGFVIARSRADDQVSLHRAFQGLRVAV